MPYDVRLTLDGWVADVPPAVARRAVAVIAPPPERHAECEVKVFQALVMAGTDASGLRRGFHSRTKRAKLAAARLSKAISRLQVAFKHEDLHDDLADFFPDKDLFGILDEDFLHLKTPHVRLMKWRETDRWLAGWRKRVEDAHTNKAKTIRLKAHYKKIAIEQAIDLLLEFKREVSAAKGSRLCRLAALLHGQPRSNLSRQCGEVLRSGPRTKRGSK